MRVPFNRLATARRIQASNGNAALCWLGLAEKTGAAAAGVVAAKVTATEDAVGAGVVPGRGGAAHRDRAARPASLRTTRPST